MTEFTITSSTNSSELTQVNSLEVGEDLIHLKLLKIYAKVNWNIYAVLHEHGKQYNH